MSQGGSQNVEVAVDITGLNPGPYNTTITVDAPGASNSPQIFSVKLAIQAAGGSGGGGGGGESGGGGGCFLSSLR